MKIEHLPIGKVKLNPDNPRQISNKDFQSLVKSLQDCPDMFEARPLLCSGRGINLKPGNPQQISPTEKLIVLGGNMRLRAARKLGYKKVPVIIMHGLTEAQEKEITIKDNGAWGAWDFDALANAWSDLPLKDWGVGVPTDWMQPLDAQGLPEPGSGEEKNNKTTCPKCGFTYAI
ncbi:MAG: ParB N-terminal domain-containing protein [Bacteroidetes bacterium]|nr:ParB N-terminal domain-containing protein [Bacteroidota bacterium]